MVRKLDPYVTNMRSRRSGDNEMFFPAVYLQRLKNAEQRKLDYEWQGRIYPSSLSFSMCPYNHVRVECQTWNPPDSDGMERIEMGKAKHRVYTKLVKDFESVEEVLAMAAELITDDETSVETILKEMYQFEAKNHEDLLWGRIPVPECLKDDTRKEWEKEYQSKYPAIPAIWPEKYISGEVDLVLRIDGKPVIVDLKFPQEPDPTLWLTKRRDFPSEAYETQVCVYAEIFNANNYLPEKIEKVGVLALNPYIKSSRGQATVEWYADYNDVRQNKTQLLISHLVKEVDAFNNGEESECTYPLCGKHAK